MKLTPVERAKIEEEFKNKREAMIDPVFALSMRRSEQFTEIPTALAEKVLNDILDTWAQQADLRKGAEIPGGDSLQQVVHARERRQR